MKYIVFRNRVTEDEFPLIFSEHLEHFLIDSAMRDTHHYLSTISAGFCTPAGNAYGKSVTLGLHSRDEDSDLIKKTMEFRT